MNTSSLQRTCNHFTFFRDPNIPKPRLGKHRCSLPLTSPAHSYSFTGLHTFQNPPRQNIAASSLSSSLSSMSSPTIPVTFKVEYRTHFGQILKIVGSSDALGNWNVKEAPAMEWSDGDVWSVVLDFTPGLMYEFKLVVATSDSAIWEGGANRKIKIPSLTKSGGRGSSGYEVVCHWSNPVEVLELKAAGPDVVASESDGEGVLLSDDLSGNVTGIDDEDTSKAEKKGIKKTNFSDGRIGRTIGVKSNDRGPGPAQAMVTHHRAAALAVVFSSAVAASIFSSPTVSTSSPLYGASADTTAHGLLALERGDRQSQSTLPEIPWKAPDASVERMKKSQLSLLFDGMLVEPTAFAAELGVEQQQGDDRASATSTSTTIEKSTLEEFRARLRWLNEVTSAATEELDAIAPPPLKGALEGAVKSAKETDIRPALEVARRVVGDLQEGFGGLLDAAKDFDVKTATLEKKAASIEKYGDDEDKALGGAVVDATNERMNE